MPEPFAPFIARLTRGYAILAVALIVLVVTTTSLLAFLLYVGALNDSIHAAAQRAAEAAATYERQGVPLSVYASELAREVGGTRVHVLVYDGDHRLVAQSGGRSPSAPLARAAAA
ncbi:MAG: hypothetical protein WA814_13230, partial [Candidatus Baltobacteraceae bacterium]